MAIPLIGAGVLGWLASAVGIPVAELTIGSILRGAFIWFVRVFATKVIAKIIVFGLILGLAEFMPEVFVVIFTAIGDATMMIAEKMGTIFVDAINSSSSTQVNEAANLFNSNVNAMPQSWRDVIASLGITPLLGFIEATYFTIFVIETIEAVHSAYTLGRSIVPLGNYGPMPFGRPKNFKP